MARLFGCARLSFSCHLKEEGSTWFPSTGIALAHGLNPCAKKPTPKLSARKGAAGESILATKLTPRNASAAGLNSAPRCDWHDLECAGLAQHPVGYLHNFDEISGAAIAWLSIFGMPNGHVPLLAA